MHIDLLTLFPQMAEALLADGVVARGLNRGLFSVAVHDWRAFGVGPHRATDDTPYGGGHGMILRPEPLTAAVEAILERPVYRSPGMSTSVDLPPIILLTPQGRRFDQSVAAELVQQERILLIAGRYEGFDERIRRYLATDELSIGDFVLAGGELAALVIIDALARLIPGVLGASQSAAEDSFGASLLEHPQYTRPATFRGRSVPPELLSGHHAQVRAWQRTAALRRTWERRPDLLANAQLSPQEKALVARWQAELAAEGAEAASFDGTGHDKGRHDI